MTSLSLFFPIKSMILPAIPPLVIILSPFFIILLLWYPSFETLFSMIRKYAFGSADRFDEAVDMQRSVIDGRYVYIKNFRPELPLIYRNKYREQIPMNAKLIEMDRNNELTGDASYIFMKSKPVEEVNLGDLGIEGSTVGWAGGRQEIVSIEPAPEREAGEIIEDEGDGHEKIVSFLQEMKVI